MIKAAHLRRLLGLALLVGAVFCCLGARLVDLQVLKHERYQRIKESNTQRYFLKEPRRGDILDINNNPLAICVPVKRVLADPSIISNYWGEVAHALAPLLSYDEATLGQMLRPTVMTNAEGKVRVRSYVDLHRKVSPEFWQEITQTVARVDFGVNESKLPRSQRQYFRQLRQYGVYAKDEQQRVYPNGRLAAHVLGYTHEREEPFNDFSVTQLVGEYGIEQVLDKSLTGARGWRITETDNRRREITVYREQDLESKPGLSVVLSIDMVIQNLVEKELAEAMAKYKPASVQAVVVRPRTGEILAMATLPNFDPNQPGKASLEHLRNRVVADMVEPGSTFKVVVVSAGLNEHLINLSETFFCENGAWYYMGRTLRDAHSGYGTLSVQQIIAKSSNIGAAKIGLKVGKERLYQYIRNYGFGSRTGIPLQGEVTGWVHPLPDWDKDKVMITRVPMGQSITVTHLQMAMAFSAIANKGKLMRPMLINRLQDATGRVLVQYTPTPVRQVISEDTAEQLLTALKSVVSKEGTALKAALDHYTVAGKTGTAQKTVNRVVSHEKYVSSFIGFFPADDPEVCISVVMDEPDIRIAYYGGQTTAPMFKKLAEQIASYYHIKPDREITPPETLAGAAQGNLHTAAVRQN